MRRGRLVLRAHQVVPRRHRHRLQHGLHPARPRHVERLPGGSSLSAVSLLLARHYVLSVLRFLIHSPHRLV